MWSSGTEGRRCEVFNASKSAIIIPPYVAIWSMHLIAVDEPLYRGRYQGQTGIHLQLLEVSKEH